MQDVDGRVLARRRLPEGSQGVAQLHALLAEHAPSGWEQLTAEQIAERVGVGIQTDRGAWGAALRAAGYQLFAIDPMSVARYRKRHSTSGAKGDAGDAHVLAAWCDWAGRSTGRSPGNSGPSPLPWTQCVKAARFVGGSSHGFDSPQLQ